MQLPSDEEIKESLERAEKCLKENNLNRAENEYSWASTWIEARQANQGNDSVSDVAKLNEFSGRLNDIEVKIAVERRNQGSQDNPESEIDHKYLFTKLSSIEETLYDENKNLVNEYIACGRRLSSTQAGKRSIVEKVRNRLLGSSATKRRDKLKEEVSKTGYPAIRKIVNLTETLSLENKEQQNYLNNQIHQEILTLPEPLKTEVESSFKKAKESQVRTGRGLIPTKEDSGNGSEELPRILLSDTSRGDQESQSPIEWIPTESDHELSNLINTEGQSSIEEEVHEESNSVSDWDRMQFVINLIQKAEMYLAKNRSDITDQSLEKAQKYLKEMSEETRKNPSFLRELKQKKVIVLTAAAEIFIAQGKNKMAKDNMDEAQKYLDELKDAKNDPQFLKELKQKKIIALTASAEILIARGKSGMAKNNMDEAQQLLAKLDKEDRDVQFIDLLMREKAWALRFSANILEKRGKNKMAQKNLVEAGNLER